jgi:hypothetical protein
MLALLILEMNMFIDDETKHGMVYGDSFQFQY